MIMLSPVPHGRAQINAVYGNPDANGDGILDLQWFAENIRVFNMPFPMRLSWKPDVLTQRFQAHKLIGDAVIDALAEIGLAHDDPDYLDNHGYNRWGGCFNFRFAKGNPDALSAHSWGIAVDINPHLGPFGVAAHKQPAFIIEAFKRRGFFPGADWPLPYTDAQHFQAATGY